MAALPAYMAARQPQTGSRPAWMGAGQVDSEMKRERESESHESQRERVCVCCWLVSEIVGDEESDGDRETGKGTTGVYQCAA
eukprot:3111720-Rhodomonas_salina.1